MTAKWTETTETTVPARVELAAFESAVTDWELDRYWSAG